MRTTKKGSYYRKHRSRTVDIELPEDAVDDDLIQAELTAGGLADLIYDWARNAGALSDGPRIASSTASLSVAFAPMAGLDLGRTEARLKALRVVAVAADNAERHVAIFSKNKISEAANKELPKNVGAITIEYIGGADLAPAYPQPPIPMSTVSGGSRFWAPNGKFACGSSITVAPIHGAGTLGALVRLSDGKLYGLSNNHVTGDCNHTEVGMHIMCPSGIDAEVGNLPPTAIGKHTRLTPINSGDPSQIGKQELDAAIFEITDEDLVTSWQGNMEYDTPVATVHPMAHLRVKKVGRTTGLTAGKINAEVVTPLAIPYKSSKNTSLAHYTGLWSVSTLSGEPFADAGDSGALVVTADGSAAVGIVLGGQGGMTLIMPIQKVLNYFSGARLIGCHNL
jgi:hypothetical protein